MSSKEMTPTQLARAERMREAAENGAQARAEVAARDVAIRQNMERLRALRLAQEASAPPMVKVTPRGKKPAAAKKTAAGKLSDFIRDQQDSGRKV